MTVQDEDEVSSSKIPFLPLSGCISLFHMLFCPLHRDFTSYLISILQLHLLTPLLMNKFFTSPIVGCDLNRKDVGHCKGSPQSP